VLFAIAMERSRERAGCGLLVCGACEALRSRCMTADISNDLSRLRWRCRRGLLELDLVLTRFLDGTWPTLDADTRTRFVHVIDRGDNDLWDLVAGRADLADPQDQRIVELLRAA
jgi:succinate dehydrogenase flavin-adding protein (antitoxin of CptAB toxin-antitoxin module)